MVSFGRESIEHFQRRLAETKTWCAWHDWTTNPAQSLRTAFLRPPELKQNGEIIWETDLQRLQIIERLATLRAASLQEQPAQSLPDGRLLAFDIDGSLNDGAASVATQGFFDIYNVPAWDTWITYVMNQPLSHFAWKPFDSYLLSWVPEPLVQMVAAGIDANPEVCICWATDLDATSIQQLLQSGLMR